MDVDSGPRPHAGKGKKDPTSLGQSVSELARILPTTGYPTRKNPPFRLKGYSESNGQRDSTLGLWFQGLPVSPCCRETKRKTSHVWRPNPYIETYPSVFKGIEPNNPIEHPFGGEENVVETATCLQPVSLQKFSGLNIPCANRTPCSLNSRATPEETRYSPSICLLAPWGKSHTRMSNSDKFPVNPTRENKQHSSANGGL